MNKRTSIHHAIIFITAISALLNMGFAYSRPSIATEWQNYYTNSSTMTKMNSATGAVCQVCHAEVTGGPSWNNYGWSMRQNIGLGIPGAFIAVENIDADNDGNTNLAEINFGSQPGWTTTGNLAYFSTGEILNANAPSVTPLDLPLPPPVINGFWPGTANSGEFIFIFGQSFAVDSTTPVVRFNNIQTSFVQLIADDLLIAVLPSGNTVPGLLTVTTSAGEASINFGVLPGATVKVNGIWPGEAKVGDIVFVFGENFDQTGLSQVLINNIEILLVQVLDPGVLLFVVPATVTTGPVCVTVGANTGCSTIDLTIQSVVNPADLGSIPQSEWTETSVRKVLHAFAYAGLTTDAQIAMWASMTPEAAIVEMLTFTYNNERLSPSEDASSANASSLESMQNFWGGSDVTNPMRWDKQRFYPTLTTAVDGTTTNFNTGNLQRTWTQAVSTRGINPFLHKMSFFLTNYHMSIRANLAGNGLFRSYYDQIAADLVSGQPFTKIIAGAAKSAATARRYRHMYNTYNNSNLRFSGNDDFAREFFQLFFRYNGVNEDIVYHEGVNIENNAMLLTGMNIDKLTNAYGSNNSNDWFIAPIVFTDHTDDTGRILNNASRHHLDCLEIFHQLICGATAAEKIDALSPIVASDPEVMSNLPVYIASYFADDQLTSSKMTQIKTAWAAANDDLLTFIRSYAISKAFHSEDTIKFRSTFNRNMTIYNTVILDNNEAFIGRQYWDSPLTEMRNQGGEVFLPAHDVFGGQTGTEAAGNPNVFKSAYDAAGLYTTSRLARTNLTYFTDATQVAQATWDKDWGSVIPTNSSGLYVVGDVANWLWRRVVGDGGKNFDIVARSQVLAMLARGWDFGYAVTVLDPLISTDPEATYSSAQLFSDARLVAVMDTLAAETMQLTSSNITTTRRTENRFVNYAANFIAMLPYTFVLEGK